MLVDLSPIISKGIIDNTRRGVISLQLWSTRAEEPLQLELEGDCLQDIAGCRVQFTCGGAQRGLSVAQQRPLYKLAHELQQEGATLTAGDITLSRRSMAADDSGRVVNLLSIELFLNTSLRIIIEQQEFDYELSLPEWECSQACQAARRMLNMWALREHIITNVASYRGPSYALLGEKMPACRWDGILNRAEAYMAILPSVHEKYALEPDGLQAEAFVLERTDLLGKMADAAEHNLPYEAQPYHHSWEILDFVGDENAQRVADAMKHPLFDTTIELSYIMQRYIISDLRHYRGNPEIEHMVAQFAGIISLVLGTILLSQDPLPPPGVAIARACELTARLEKLKFYHKHLRPKAADKYLSGVCALIAGLKNFVCTLRS